MLLFHASGGRIRSGKKVVEWLGAFPPAIVGDDGAVVTPMGPPNTVLLRARYPGRARIELMLGDPFHGPQTTTVELRVGG